MTAAGASVWSRALARWTSWVAQHWLVVLAVLALGTAVAGTYVVERLGINTDTAGMLSDELEFRRNYETYKDMFPQYVDTLLLVVEAEAPELADAAVDRLAARLRSDETRFERIYRPGGGDFVHRHGLLYMELPALRELADRLVRMQPFMGTLTHDPSLRGLLTLLRRALDEAGRQPIPLEGFLRRVEATVASTLAGRPAVLSWRDLLSGDASGSGTVHRALLVAQPHMDWDSLLPGAAAIEAVHRQARAAGIGPDTSLRLRVTGDVALAHEELLSLKRSAGRVALLALSMVLAVLFLGLRSPRLVLATLVTLLSGIVWTAAFAALAVGQLNLISVAFAVLYIGLGIDFAIHWCLRYVESARVGRERRSLAETAADIGPALTLCAATTALAFYAFVPTAFRGVSELGLIAGTGMLVALIATFTLLPALLQALGAPRSGRGGWRPSGLRELPHQRPRAVLAGAGVLAIAAGLAWPYLEFSYDPMNLRDPDSESVRTYRALMAESPLPPMSAVSLADGGEAARAQVERLRALPVVDKALSLDSFVPDEQAPKLEILSDLSLVFGPTLFVSAGEAPAPSAQRAALAQTLPRVEAFLDEGPSVAWRAELAALTSTLRKLETRLEGLAASERSALLDRIDHALFATFPMALARLRTALDAQPIDRADLPASLRRRWVTPQGSHRVEVFPAVDVSRPAALREFVTGVRGAVPTVTGAPVLMLEAGDAVIRAFRNAFVYAMLVIGAVLILLTRNVAATILILVPLLLGSLYTGGAMAAFGLTFNFANVIALPLLLGIGVDYGIHLVQRARGLAEQHGHGLLRTSTARALFFSAVTTVVSFGNLAVSEHRGMASMGLLLTFGVLLTLAATLVVLPALLRVFPSASGAGR